MTTAADLLPKWDAEQDDSQLENQSTEDMKGILHSIASLHRKK